MRDEKLPSVNFKFTGNSKDQVAPRLPEYVHVEIASYWSIMPSGSP
jgi:hypothetical protein